MVVEDRDRETPSPQQQLKSQQIAVIDRVVICPRLSPWPRYPRMLITWLAPAAIFAWVPAVSIRAFYCVLL